MKDRERRRDRTWRYAHRAQREHLRVVHPDGVVDCFCEQSALYFKKRKALGCRGSKKGAAHTSKLGTCCKGGFCWRESVVERRTERRLARGWLDRVAAGWPLDDVEL